MTDKKPAAKAATKPKPQEYTVGRLGVLSAKDGSILPAGDKVTAADVRGDIDTLLLAGVLTEV